MTKKDYKISDRRYSLEEAKKLIFPLLENGIRIRLDDLAVGYSSDNSDLITCRICVYKGENYKELLDSLSPEALLLLVRL